MAEAVEAHAVAARHTERPEHVAIIMDGNGRWARSRGVARSDGHRAGTGNLRTLIETFSRKGVRYLTLYAFSTENWKRPGAEVRTLTELGDICERRIKRMKKTRRKIDADEFAQLMLEKGVVTYAANGDLDMAIPSMAAWLEAAYRDERQA